MKLNVWHLYCLQKRNIKATFALRVGVIDKKQQQQNEILSFKKQSKRNFFFPAGKI